MDHSYGLSRRFEASPAAIAVGARMVSFLHGGGRLVVVAGPPGSGTSDILDLVLEGMPARVMRVRNRLPLPLDLPGILAQIHPGEIGVEMTVDGAGDDAAALLRCLSDRLLGEGPAVLAPAVLAIDDAHTLTPRALAALTRVPGLGGPDLPGAILLLAGNGALLDLLAARGLERMRDPCSALTIRLPGLAEPAAAPAAPEPRFQPARSTTLGAVTALIMAMVLLLRPSATTPPDTLKDAATAVASLQQPLPTPTPPVPAPMPARPPGAPASIASTPSAPMPAAPVPAAPVPAAPAPAASAALGAPSPAPEPTPTAAPLAGPVTAAPVSTPAPTPSAAGSTPVTPPPAPPVAELLDILHPIPSPPPSPNTPLRREFGTFLNRAGQDTALLTPEARETLFREYLEWRQRSGQVRKTATGR